MLVILLRVVRFEFHGDAPGRTGAHYRAAVKRLQEGRQESPPSFDLDSLFASGYKQAVQSQEEEVSP